MLLMLLPIWGFLMWMSIQSKKQMEQQQAEATKQAAVSSPVDKIAAEPDPKARVSALSQYLATEQNRMGPEGQRAQILLALGYIEMAQIREAAGDYDAKLDYEKAAQTYEQFAAQHRASPWAAHATYWAGVIYGRHVSQGDDRHRKKMVKLLGGLAFEHRSVWVPSDDGSGMWEERRALIESGKAVEPYVNSRFGYRLLDTLVRICGGAKQPLSYVMALLLVSIIVKVVSLPLAIRGQVAMKTMQAKMARIQPQIEEIKKKYANDQMKAMQEQSKLMKESGISMMGGCLPQLIQLPFIFYLYYAIRLYSYHFENGSFLWITDLSRPDLPLLVIYAVSMIASTKLTPQPPATDPQQQNTQRMMTYMMPAFLFLVLRTFPAAFIFYWAAFNVLGTAQQVWMNKAYPGPKPEDLGPGRHGAPAPARRLSSGGSGWLERFVTKREDGRGNGPVIDAPARGNKLSSGKGRAAARRKPSIPPPKSRS